MCYGLVAFLGLLGLHRRRWVFPAVTLFFSAAYGVPRYLADGPRGVSGPLLMASFFAGVTLYAYRSLVRVNAERIAIAIVVAIIALTDSRLIYLLPFPLAYVTVAFGLKNPRRIWIVSSGDYSYGLFVYGYAIQQALFTTVSIARNWYGNIALALPLSFAVAWMSWTLVEAPALSLKKYLYAFGTSRARVAGVQPQN